ncbi:MAG: four helix bundle protein [Candidatus Promineifilaceae bacterium]
MIKMPMTYDEWERTVPKSISSDPLWGFDIYRKALFLADLAWIDCDKLIDDRKGRSLVHQLINSAGSVAANIEEGYGRGFGKDYARFQRIALGSAREVRGWYYRTRHVFGPETIDHRMNLLDEIVAGLVLASKMQRNDTS